MAMRKSIVVFLILQTGLVGAETNGVSALAPVVVWGERVRAAGNGLPVAVPWREASSELSARGQGEGGTVSDLSVNGSSFSEAGMIFNGATVRNAQTEHYNADLPVAPDWLGEGRVLTGLELFRMGAGHPAGSLAVELEPPVRRGGRATAGVGLGGHAYARAQDLEVLPVGDGGRFWAGAFVEGAHADRVDGYDANPMDKSMAGGRIGFGTGIWSFDAVVSWAWRDFGCTGMYGANEKYPAWEEDHTGVVSADWKYDDDDDQASALSVLWTRGRDVYRLYRENPDFYENSHLADTVTFHGKTRRHVVDWAFVDLRGDADAEIYSTRHHTHYPGAEPKTKREDFRRFHGSFAVLPGVRWRNWEFAIGASGEFYSDYGAVCTPAGGVTYAFEEDLKLELSYREGCRMPSFTELTYDSPDSKGTIDLPVQRTRSLNLDVKREGMRAGMFVMRSEDLVDWLKQDRQSAWKATALDPVTSFGLSGDGEWKASEALAFVPRGAVMLKRTATDYWSSRYSMDFPIAAGSIEVIVRVMENWRLSYRQGVAVWKTNPVRRSSPVQNISRLETVFELPFYRNLELTAGLSDLFDQAFEVYPGQKAFGLSGYLAVSWKW